MENFRRFAPPTLPSLGPKYHRAPHGMSSPSPFEARMNLMDDSGTSEWSQRCRCGKRFYQPNSFTNHIQNCRRYKEGVGSSLESAKARWAAKAEKPRKGAEAIESWYAEGDLDVDIDIARPPPPPGPDNGEHQEILPADLPPLGRGFRTIKPVERYDHNFVATSTTLFQRVPDTPSRSATPETQAAASSQAGPLTISEQRRQSIADRSHWKTTVPNPFHFFKVYWTLEERPHDPDSLITHVDLVDDDTANEPDSRDKVKLLSSLNPYHPFPNYSSYMLGQWFWSDEDKSRGSFQELIHILTSEEFRCKDLLPANWNAIHASLAASQFDGASGQLETESVTSFRPGPQTFTVNGFRYRPLVPLIRSKLEDAQCSDHFHIVPYDLLWRLPGSTGPCRVYGELYHSPSFLDAYRDVQALPPEPAEDHLPRYVVALMFSSDETMLTSFGNAKLWPLYLSFGNESKYRRAKTGLGLMEEVAYFQHLPDEFDNWYITLSHKRRVGKPLTSHVNRELFQEQWKVLLDADFVQAYRHGLVISCSDGVRRRFYPRILTYAADYPEKHDDGRTIHELGLPEDRNRRIDRRRVDNEDRRSKVEKARKTIYSSNYSVNSPDVEKQLKATSLVPTQNAFSERLASFGLDVYDIVAVDILHEVEIGVWKSLFIHLLRILEVVDVTLVNTVNERFRQIPTFGKNTIRRFNNNISELKQLAARNYEDILQCSLAVFEGLFPGDHDLHVQDLLFAMAHWHALAKLRMHTDQTLDVLDQWTTVLGEDSRKFVNSTCLKFPTKELQREYEARKRREARKTAGKSSSINSKGVLIPSVSGESAQSRTLGADRSQEKPRGQKRKQDASNSTRSHADTMANEQADSSMAAGSDSGGQPEGKGHKRKKVVATPDLYAIPPTALISAPQSSGALGGVEDEAQGRRDRTWNINTPKFHVLGDVAMYIRRFGTSDSYSTQLSERAHRFPKFRYRRTNKKGVPLQLSRIQTRQNRLQKLRKQIELPPEELPQPFDPISAEPARGWYFIGKSQNQPVHLGNFIRVNEGDLAVKGFLMKMKRHLFPRLITMLLQEAKMKADDYAASIPILQSLSVTFTDDDLKNIHFHSDRIYRHAIFKIRYTTYDCRYDHDTFNPSTSRRDFMCLRADSDTPPSTPNHGGAAADKPYSYGRLLGVFHTNVVYSGPGALDFGKRRLDFLWVRWFVQEPRTNDWSVKRQDLLTLAPVASPGSCDFLDPANILRGAHIIPRFSSGPRYGEADTQRRILSKCAHEKSDWKMYYVNRFVDRDMAMRFHPGLAPGHLRASHRAPTESPSLTSGQVMDCDVPVHSPAMGSMDVQMGDSAEVTDSEDSNYDSVPSDDGLSDTGSLNSDISEVQDPDSGSEDSEVYHN
ncbi:hypothetical protein NMY22_g14461 [Coprinellus aureogranulatus]|nr:hypothetical protein NMY22_g14461 [Coprinellus aureogranulatus]